MKLRDLGEFGLIDRLQAKLPPVDETVVVGIGDDAAVLSLSPGTEQVLTTDMLVEGVHFRKDTIDFRSLGWKSMAASISDIAAMGGKPRHATISLAIPADFEVSNLEELYEGVAEICSTYQTHVVGGDIVKTSGPLIISVTLTGEAEKGKALLRSGAQPGDLVFVTGKVGGSAAGLALLQSHQRSWVPADEQVALTLFHQRPVPQVEAGRILATAGGCTSLNDISDGLASELNEIATASGVGIRIEEQRIPIDASVTNWARQIGRNPLDWALYGGEDYQLVGTLHPHAYPEISNSFQASGLEISLIGRVTEAAGVILERTNGEEMAVYARGYNHFSD